MHAYVHTNIHSHNDTCISYIRTDIKSSRLYLLDHTTICVKSYIALITLNLLFTNVAQWITARVLRVRGPNVRPFSAARSIRTRWMLTSTRHVVEMTKPKASVAKCPTRLRGLIKIKIWINVNLSCRSLCSSWSGLVSISSDGEPGDATDAGGGKSL